jgi:Domain of unknown function (DUF1905)
MKRFTAVLQRDEDSGGHWVEVPFDGKAEFGAARAPVRGTLNGTPFEGRLAVYGGVTVLGLRKEIRDAAGIAAGDSVDVELERDESRN